MIALDLFAGTGWGVACKALGIEEHGVEIMPAAIATREANGMTTIFNDVWDGLDGDVGGNARDHLNSYELLIASPPCQTFSMAGKGTGRKALDEVLSLIEERAFLHPHKLREFGEKHDPRTALVLTPLTYIARDLPRLVVLEQVPQVLPVWEAYAVVMREWGYSVKTAVLNAEQYGVPQTRKRAILVARWDAEATLPAPTHSLYYSRDRARLDDGVLPWVSMAEALDWGMTDRPYMTVAAGTASGGTDPAFLGGSGARKLLVGERDGGRWKPRWAYERPATTISGDARVWPPGHKYNNDDIRRLGEEEAKARYGDRAGSEAIRLTDAEASAIQSYPAGFDWRGNRGDVAQQIGNAVPPLLAEAVLREMI
jgi:DNA (cytosine-5)-methyltransferase 1